MFDHKFQLPVRLLRCTVPLCGHLHCLPMGYVKASDRGASMRNLPSMSVPARPFVAATRHDGRARQSQLILGLAVGYS